MHEHAWGVVLAAGHEARLPLALDRLGRLVPPERMLAVVQAGYEGGAVASEVIEEPADRGTAIAALIAAMHARERDPLAVLVVQAGVDPPGLDRRRLTTLEGACRLAGSRDDAVLMLEGRTFPVLVARAEALVDQGMRAIPEAAPGLATYRQVLHAVHGGRAVREHLRVALHHLYSRLPEAGYGPVALLGAPGPHAGAPQRKSSLSAPSRPSTLH